ncbi:uncharacterized protein L203_103789 [Cryptococcus depauperatus CBS 7841]|uniref:Uncharacterized protein n=1 Tax=Cryptococcus depauperatus CBS 7841 TaxID=1295531 RepID=A0AAJ8JU79_9TREE
MGDKYLQETQTSQSSDTTYSSAFDPSTESDTSVNGGVDDSADEVDETVDKNTEGASTPRGPGRIKQRRLKSDETLRASHQKFEKAVNRIEDIFDNLYLLSRPYTDRLLALAEHRPLFFTFASLWMLLSFFPLVVFVGFVVVGATFILLTLAFTVLATTISTVVLAFFAMVGTIALGLTMLLPTLFVTTIISLSLLSFLLALFVSQRLYLHVTTATSEEMSVGNVADGVRGWVDELRERAFEAVGLVSENPYISTNQVEENPSELLKGWDKRALLKQQLYNTTVLDEKYQLSTFEDSIKTFKNESFPKVISGVPS